MKLISLQNNSNNKELKSREFSNQKKSSLRILINEKNSAIVISLRFIAFLVLWIAVSSSVMAQTNYTSNPSIGSLVGCSPSGSIAGSGCPYTYYGGYLDLRVSNISNNTITFQVQLCAGTFSNNAVFYLKESTSSNINTVVCGTEYPSSGLIIPNGASSYSYSFSPNFANETRYYSVVVILSGLRMYSKSIAITASTTATPPTTPSNPNPSSGSTGISTSPALGWNSTLSGGTVGYDLYISTYQDFSTYTIYQGQGTSRSITGLSNSTTYYWKVISYGSNGSTSSWSPVWNFSTEAALQVPTTPSNPSPSSGSTGISTSPTLGWNSTLSGGTVGYDLYISTSQDFSTYTLYQGQGTSRSISGLSNNTTYYWKVISYGSNGTTSSWSPVWNFSTEAALQVPTTPSNPSPSSGSTGISTSPTLGWNSSLSGGTVGYDLYISTSQDFSTYTLYQGQGTSRSITGLSNSTTYYWKVISYGSNGTTSSWSPVWNFTTTNSTTGCFFSDCTSSQNCGNTNYQETTYNAIQYLCNHNIVTGNNGLVYPDELINRAQLAKIALYGVYGDSTLVPEELVSDYFPSPYADLQERNTYYYRAAKALLYLDFGDGVTPFDRNRFYFNPDGNIERNLVLKVLLESFNIAPDNTGPSPFSDYPATSPFYGYAKKAYSLGITDATEFRPYEYCTRAEAFIFLHRIMIKSPSLFPTINNNLNPQTSSFQIPSNISIANMNSNKGIETGNFNHYTKSCFSIPGRNVSLDFDFTYNSYISELPEELYPLNPMGSGWSHTYNMYMNFIYGPTVYDTRFAVHMPDGSLLIYKLDENNAIVPETEGNYNTLTNIPGYGYEFKTKSQVTYTFKKLGTNDIAHVLTSIQDRNLNTITINYTQGENYTIPGTSTIRTTRKISSVSDPAGRILQFTYHTGTNYIQTVTDPLSRVISFSYSNGQLITYTDAKDQITSYNYGTSANNFGLLVSIQLPKGNVINNQYQQRKLTSTQFNSNSPTTVAHTPNYVAGINNFYKSTVTVPQQGTQSITTNYEMDKKGNITKADGNDAVNLSSTYNNSSHPTMPSSITNNLNNVTVTPTYDDQSGNVTQITTSGGGITTSETFVYNSYNDVLQHSNANGQTTYYEYNSSGNLTKVRDALNNETNINNNSYGQPTSITNPSGVSVNFGYNSYGNQNQVSIPSLGLTASMNYDAGSRMISATNFGGQTSTYTYDANDNLLTENDAMNHATNYAYDLNDNLTSITNAKGNATTFSYDQVTDWLLSESFQGATKNYTYNDDGSLKTFQNPNGNTLTYSYDNSGRIMNDGYATYSYASNGNLVSIDKGGKAITFAYDGLNRVTSVTYDGNTVSYTYDNIGNVLTMTYPGNKTVTYNYDAVNNLKTVRDWNNNTASYNYRPDGQLADMVYPNGVKTTYTYDNAGRPTGISTKRNNGSGSVIAEYAFTLDPVGNHTQESIIEQYTTYPAIPNATINYTYNNANRIQSAGSISFGFDNNGNTTSKTGSTFAYDVLNNLTSVNGTFNANYVYDGAGNRREATRNGVLTKYVLDILGMSNVLMETDAGGTPQNYYVYGLGLVSRIKPDNKTHYYVYDYRGSTVAMIDASTSANVTHKYQYDEFGTVLQAEEADFNPFRYVGKYGVMHENQELQFMRARYYDSAIGRFLSEDPIWSTNLYPYADNNPNMWIDPQGTLIDPSFTVNKSIASKKGNISMNDAPDLMVKTSLKYILDKGADVVPINTITKILPKMFLNKNYQNVQELTDDITSVTIDAANIIYPGLGSPVKMAIDGYGKMFDFIYDRFLEKKYKTKQIEIKLYETIIRDQIKKQELLKKRRNTIK